MTQPGRNDPCPCGSGKKYKHCCQAKDAAQAAKERPGAGAADAHFHCHQGHVLRSQGRLNEAIQCYQQALLIQPGFGEAHFCLGDTFQALGRFDEALANYQQVLLRQPNLVEAYCNMGITLQAQGKLDEAIASYRKALSLRPSVAEAHTNLGNALQEQNRLDEAIASYRKALFLKPSIAEAWYNLANALGAQSQLDESVHCYQQALLLRPDYVDAHCNLATTLVAQGHIDEAIASYRQALLLKPDFADAHSTLLFNMQYSSTCSPAEMFREHQRYAETFEAPLKPFWQAHVNSREPLKRLMVGYVSGDFCTHVVASFFEPILASHDPSQFEIFGYYNSAQRDSHTDWIAAHMDHFTVCNTLSDDALAERIRADGIDILVDLSGHTANNRLRVFARKPAPVQVTWIGYPGSSGLTAMDYRITDAWQDPPGQTEAYHSETLVRLPGGALSFQPESNLPAVNALPGLSADGLVFASLNNLSKVNPAVVNLWARILHALPNARLMLGNVNDSRIEQHLLGLFDQAGIGPARLILKPKLPMADFLALHHQIDIALDPFPYNGGATTMYALAMGVPVITLPGQHAVSRFSAAALSRVGLSEFISHTEDEYLQCALKYAQDLPALNQIRQSLRKRIIGAAWEPANITRSLEAAYRDMWQKWCAQ